MKKALLLLVTLIWVLGTAPSLSAAPKKLNVYMAKGKGAISILDQADYQTIFRNRIFANDALTIDLTSGKAAFLSHFFASDLVYLSLHANQNVWVVGNGERVEVVDLVRAHQAAGRAPALVIVTGCSTIQTSTKVNFAASLGVHPGTAGRAYIGYKTFTPGEYSDRYFRVFLAEWMSSKPDGSYRTLEEARVDAKTFIHDQIALQGPTTGVTSRFAPIDQNVADWFTIVGDSSLRVTDL